MTMLFISYSRENMTIVQASVLELQNLGLSVWTDTTGIIAGKNFSTEIAQAITDCDFFLLFVSSTSIKSDFVRREVDVAHKKGRRIIPIQLEEVDIPTELDLQLAGLQWIEQYKDSRWMYRLLLAIGATTPDIKTLQEQVNIVEEDHTSDANTSRANESEENQRKLQPIISSLTKVIKIFERDFIYPKECDEVVTQLRELVKNQSFDQQQIYLQYVFDVRISELVDQIFEFRKICQLETLHSENERKSILQGLSRLVHDLTN